MIESNSKTKEISGSLLSTINQPKQYKRFRLAAANAKTEQ